MRVHASNTHQIKSILFLSDNSKNRFLNIYIEIVKLEKKPDLLLESLSCYDVDDEENV